MGQSERASRLCTYLLGNVLDEEGDFVGHFSPQPCTSVTTWSPTRGSSRARNGWGQFGISLRGVDFIGGLQHATSGGFYTAGRWRRGIPSRMS